MKIGSFNFFSKPSNQPPASHSIPKMPRPGVVLSESRKEMILAANLKKEEDFAALLASPIIDLEKLREKSWAGVPDKFRATTWRLFLDYEPVNSSVRESTIAHKRRDYFDCLGRVFSDNQRFLWTNAQKQTILQIQRDLPRTNVPLLRCEKVQKMFERVLFLWSVRHPASGYVQGMNDLLQPFFYAFLQPHTPNQIDIKSMLREEDISMISNSVLDTIEADCFWSFSKLLDGLQDMFTKDQPKLYQMLESLKNVIGRVDPALSAHLDEEGVSFQEFAFRWMNCLLVREFAVPSLFRIWDLYLSRHSTISQTHVFVCAGMLKEMSPFLLNMGHAEIVIFLQGIKPDDWTNEQIEGILAQAYIFDSYFGSSPSHLRSQSMPNLSS